jgi:isopentenyl diphosphate isomerase/L-lactate dehydrogenase-like FMN-dependent dehydrogenase
MSTASSTNIEEAGAANGSGERWYQLYWPQNEHNNITLSLLKRAKASGFSVLVVTLDVRILTLYNDVHADSDTARLIFWAGVLRTWTQVTTHSFYLIRPV